MRRILALVLFMSLFLKCSNREVQLPQLNHTGIGEIQNHSGIWIFFETDGTDTLAVMNKNNKLQNTHWIFHVDKRLPMGELAPLMNAMQEDHDKDSMHKKEGMSNYFSFADSTNSRMSLLPFDKTIFKMASKGEVPNLADEPCQLVLTIHEKKFELNGYMLASKELTERLDELPYCTDRSQIKLILSYASDLSFQRYLEVKADLQTEGLVTAEEEWVFRIK